MNIPFPTWSVRIFVELKASFEAELLTDPRQSDEMLFLLATEVRI